MARPEIEPEWQVEAIRLMVQNGCSLKQAAIELDIPLTSEQAEVMLRRRSFNKRLWEERNRYFAQIGSDPQLRKETIIGQLLDLAKKLEYEGKYKDSGTALFQAAKVAGYVGAEQQVNVFGELTSKDLDQIKNTLVSGKNIELN